MNITTIDATPRKCEMCGKTEELRPYGPKGEWVCFDCGMKDEESAKIQFNKLFDNNDLIVIQNRPTPK